MREHAQSGDSPTENGSVGGRQEFHFGGGERHGLPRKQELNTTVGASVKMAVEVAGVEDDLSVDRIVTDAVSIYHHWREATRRGDKFYRVTPDGEQVEERWPQLEHLRPPEEQVSQPRSVNHPRISRIRRALRKKPQ